MAVTSVQPLPGPPRNFSAIFQQGFARRSESMLVNSCPSFQPVASIAFLFRTWVTRCTSAMDANALVCDQPTRGTLAMVGFAASAMTSTRSDEFLASFEDVAMGSQPEKSAVEYACHSGCFNINFVLMLCIGNDLSDGSCDARYINASLCKLLSTSTLVNPLFWKTQTGDVA